MDSRSQLLLLKKAGKNPGSLALASVDLTFPQMPGENRNAVKTALMAAAVPHWFDEKFLAALLRIPEETAGGLTDHLRALRVVEPYPARGPTACNVRDRPRAFLRKRLRSSDPAAWAQWSQLAYDHVKNCPEPHFQLEALSHLVVLDPGAAVREFALLTGEWAVSGRPEDRTALEHIAAEIPELRLEAGHLKKPRAIASRKLVVSLLAIGAAAAAGVRYLPPFFFPSRPSSPPASTSPPPSSPGPESGSTVVPPKAPEPFVWLELGSTTDIKFDFDAGEWIQKGGFPVADDVAGWDRLKRGFSAFRKALIDKNVAGAETVRLERRIVNWFGPNGLEKGSPWYVYHLVSDQPLKNKKDSDICFQVAETKYSGVSLSPYFTYQRRTETLYTYESYP